MLAMPLERNDLAGSVSGATIRRKIKKERKSGRVLYKASIVLGNGSEQVIGWFLSRHEAKCAAKLATRRKHSAIMAPRSNLEHFSQPENEGQDEIGHGPGPLWGAVGEPRTEIEQNDGGEEDATPSTMLAPVQGVGSPDALGGRNIALPIGGPTHAPRRAHKDTLSAVKEMVSPSMLVGNGFSVLSRRKQRTHKNDSMAFKSKNISSLVHYQPYRSPFWKDKGVVAQTPHTAGLQIFQRGEGVGGSRETNVMGEFEANSNVTLGLPCMNLSSGNFNLLNTQRGSPLQRNARKGATPAVVERLHGDVHTYTGIYKRLRQKHDEDQRSRGNSPRASARERTRQWKQKDYSSHQVFASKLRRRGQSIPNTSPVSVRGSVRQMVVQPVSLSTLTNVQPLRTKAKQATRWQ